MFMNNGINLFIASHVLTKRLTYDQNGREN